jgi:ADP-ribose pyrophosphatase YjhB (NUDIX family)
MSPPTLDELEKATRRAWSRWTADPADHYRWSPENPASGQCASTALVVHDAYGGELIETDVYCADGSSSGFHYSNRLPDGRTIDLSVEQFREGERLADARAIAPPADRMRGRLPGQYHLLAARVARELAAPGAAGGRERPVSVKGVCAGGCGRVLLCRNHRGEWELPGGRPEPGELFADALVRELHEESGLEVTVGPLVGVAELQPVPGRWVDIVAFACRLTGPRGSATPWASEEHTEVAFCDPVAVELPAVYRELITRAR